MGVDWIPCRIEPGESCADIDKLVELEARHSQVQGGWIDHVLKPLIRLTDVEKMEIVREYGITGPLKKKILFKSDSHRCSVVTSDELLPLEWRLNAFRTIPPWKLANQVAAWRNYRKEVADGMHRAYLTSLFAYLRAFDLTTYFEENVLATDARAQAASGQWAKQPEAIAAHELIINYARPIALPPPPWRDDGEAEPTDSDRQLLVEIGESTDRLNDLIRSWNAATKRGNYRIRPMEPVPMLEAWIQTRLSNSWFASFLEWLQPWLDGGYGLYRDCE